MITDPSPGFTTKFNSPSIDISGKVLIDSHIQLSANTQDGSETLNSSNVYAQEFIAESTYNSQEMFVFLSRSDGEDNIIDVKIMADSAGMPDTGTILGQATIHNLTNLRPRWYKIEFSSVISLTSSTSYWLELKAVGDTEFLWYKNTDVTGVDYILNNSTLTNDESFIIKIKSLSGDDNFFELPQMESYNLQLNERLQADSGSFKLINHNSYYDEKQPLRHLLIDDAECQVQVTNNIDSLTMKTLLIDSVSKGNSDVTIKLLGKQSKLLNQDLLFKSDYIGEDYGNVVRDLIKQSKVVQGNTLYADSGLDADDGLFADSGTGIINLTGKTFPSQGTLEGKIIDGIRKIEQVTNYEFKFDNLGNPTFKAKMV